MDKRPDFHVEVNMHFADRLLAAIDAKGAAACVGLDPVVDRLPEGIQQAHGLQVKISQGTERASRESRRSACAAAIEDFSGQVIDEVAPLVPAIKINIAFFEKYGPPGVYAYERLVARGRAAGLVVIGDVKRADIGNTSAQYAEAHLDDTPWGGGPDAVTVNPYFGWDGIAPFIEVARQREAGLFVLVQTSNPSAHEVQDLPIGGKETVCHAVARLVEKWSAADGLIGGRGFSALGAVVSPRDVLSTRMLRELMPHSLLLVPGFGAQGRTAEEISHCFRGDGRGALIAASRSVLFAYRESPYRERCGDDWRSAVRAACMDMVHQVRQATPKA